MKRTLFFGALNTIALLTSLSVMGQNFQTMPVQSGYNADVIANGTGPAMSSTTMDVDGVSFAFVAKDFLATSSSTPITYGIPVDGIINSVAATTPGLSFQLGDLSGNNSLRLVNTNDTGTFVFTTPKAAFKLYMLATSGSGASTVSVTVNFTDNTSQTFSGLSLSDWYGGSNFAIQGIGRINRANNVLEPNSANPRLYQALLTMDTTNQTKPIQSVTVTKTSAAAGSIPNIFAFSADVYTDCSAPVLDPVGTLTSGSAQISWTVPPTTQAASYDIYYSTNNTPPTGSTTPNIAGFTGTSTTISNLSASTTYYYWIRTNCNTAMGQSGWSFSGTFMTLCGAVTPPYTNDFSSVPGGCWSNASGGTPATGSTGTSAYWTEDGFLSSGSTGAVRINLYSNTKIGWLKTTAFDLSAGGYKIKFDYGVTTYSGTDSSPMGSDDVVQFLVSDDGGSTWTVLQTWDVNNAPSNTLNTYSYDLTANTSSNTVFALYGSEGTINDSPDYNFYVDNFTVENAQLGTSENISRKKTVIYPNPFKDVLYVPDAEGAKSVVIGDVSGRTVKTIDNPGKELNLSMLNSGLYMITVIFKDGSKSTSKIIKQ